MNLHSSSTLNPLKAEYFYIKEPFDFTKQGNVYEKQFTMPFDFWRHKSYIAIQIFFKPNTYWRDSYCLNDDKNLDDYDLRVAFENLPIKNGVDFIKRLDYIWRPVSANKFSYGCRLICYWDDLQKHFKIHGTLIYKYLKETHKDEFFKTRREPAQLTTQHPKLLTHKSSGVNLGENADKNGNADEQENSNFTDFFTRFFKKGE